MTQPPQGPYGPPDPRQWQTGPMQPYGPPQPYVHQPQYYPPQPLPTSGLAVAATVCGIIGLVGGWCLFGIPCILAVILGHMANKEIRTGRVGGQGLATAGLVMGYIIVAPAIVVTILMIGGGISSGAAG